MKKNSVVLFQGDSITDCGRNREDHNHMGFGYAIMAASSFNATYPELNVKFLNRGISGNRVVDLKSRWQEDCIDLKPDVVSILIGINDTWRRYDHQEITHAEQYMEGYHFLLTEIRQKLDAKIVLCEPFLLPVTEDQKLRWREDLDPKIQAVRALAREFEAIYVPFDGMFAGAATKQPTTYWAHDGVHPTATGHALMAQQWLEATKLL